MSGSRHRRQQLRRLYRAQDGICAACFLPMTLGDESSPLTASRDRIIPRNQGGRYVLTNLIAKHAACNTARGDKPATSLDLAWLALVQRRLARAAEAQR